MKTCTNCNNSPCICNILLYNQMWSGKCPERKQCSCTTQFNYKCAGPAEFTGEYNIGNRPCCQGMKKCVDKTGLFQWCSHTGTCSPNVKKSPKKQKILKKSPKCTTKNTYNPRNTNPRNTNTRNTNPRNTDPRKIGTIIPNTCKGVY